jgi:tetratricopeptide (TPR) repeat protein
MPPSQRHSSIADSSGHLGRIDPDRPPIAAIRDLLEAAFTAQTLKQLCRDRPAFRGLVKRFGPADGLVAMVERTLEYCGEFLLWNELLAEVRQVNPRQFFRFAPRLYAPEEPVPEVPRPRREGVEARPEAPFQARRDVPWFVGREKELAEFCDVLAQTPGGTVYCLTGMGGVGKTTFAIHVAHALRDYFVDGVLWAEPADSDPLAILDGWGRAYGYDFGSAPDLHSRAAAMRGVLADKKALLILDDVSSVGDVRPLLPSGPGCTVLLTTRNLELAAALNAYNYPLSPLSPGESRQLMARILGQERVAAEDLSADEICRLLGHLPLAVEIAAQRLAPHRRWRLADLAERLRDEQNRLSELKVSDREVRASFGVSWERLDKALRRSFALLAVFRGRAFTAPAFAAVAQAERRTAEDHLRILTALSLLAEEGEVHFRQHPLLADFATEQMEEREAAFARMVDYYLDCARQHQHDYAALRPEWLGLLAAIQVAHQRRMWQKAVDLVRALAEAWFAQGRFGEARLGCEWACEAAEALEDREFLAACLCWRGRACIEQGDYAEAGAYLDRSLKMFRELEDRRGIAEVQYHLGRIAVERADFDLAQRLLAESRRIRAELQDRAGVAVTLHRLASVRFYQDDAEEAQRLAKQALDLQEMTGDALGCIRSLNLLSDISLDLDDCDAAQGFCLRALELCEEIREQGEMAITLYNLSDVYRRRGDLRAARDQAERSLVLLEQMGDRKSQAQTLYQLSRVNADLQEYALALEAAIQSLALCRELEDAWGAVYVQRHLGDVHQARGQAAEAQGAWQEALAQAKALEHPLADSLQERLEGD